MSLTTNPFFTGAMAFFFLVAALVAGVLSVAAYRKQNEIEKMEEENEPFRRGRRRGDRKNRRRR